MLSSSCTLFFMKGSCRFTSLIFHHLMFCWSWVTYEKIRSKVLTTNTLFIYKNIWQTQVDYRINICPEANDMQIFAVIIYYCHHLSACHQNSSYLRPSLSLMSKLEDLGIRRMRIFYSNTHNSVMIKIIIIYTPCFLPQ